MTLSRFDHGNESGTRRGCKSVYAKARLGHGVFGIGMGLENRLFPWARYRIFMHANPVVGIAPVWMRPAVSQWWRGGIDYSSYLRQLVLFGLFRKSPGELGVIAGNVRTLLSPRLPEPVDFVRRAEKSRPGTIIFEEGQDNFVRLNGWHRFLLDEIRAITRTRYIALADAIPDVPIGLCVRCGNDFKEPKPDAATLGGAEKTPVRWFAQCLALLRRTAGADVPAYVVSDGTPRQLESLLNMPNVVFVRPGSAASDLLVLAKARVLLISGASSFAAWGSFLGQMPTISHPGQPLYWWGIESRSDQFLGEFDPNCPAIDFLDQAVSRLRAVAAF